MTNESIKKKREAKFESSSDSEDEERFKDFAQVCPGIAPPCREHSHAHSLLPDVRSSSPGTLLGILSPAFFSTMLCACTRKVVIPVEEERVRTSGLPVRWSAVDKEDAVKLSDENLTASCHCGLLCC